MHGSILKNYRFRGFTLAEVLITLGIIGVVAALTIPTIVSNYQKKQTVTQLRKTFSDLNNAAKLSEVDNGPMSTWSYPSNNTTELEVFIKKYYQPYFKSSKFFSSADLRDMGYNYTNLVGTELYLYSGLILNNGNILMFYSGNNHGYLWLLADINGFNGPNKMGRDIFVFDAYKWAKEGKFYIDFWRLTTSSLKREHLISDKNSNPEYICNKNNKNTYSGYYCGALIQFDGWQILDDYPW